MSVDRRIQPVETHLLGRSMSRSDSKGAGPEQVKGTGPPQQSFSQMLSNTRVATLTNLF